MEQINLTKLFFIFQAGDVHGYDWAHHHRKRRDITNFNTKNMPSQDISEKDIPEIGSQIHTRNQTNRENSSLGITFGTLITSILLNIFLSWCLYMQNSIEPRFKARYQLEITVIFVMESKAKQYLLTI